MISEIHNRQHASSRRRASCIICKKLNECSLKDDILSPEIEVSNFAKYGCTYYERDLEKEAQSSIEAENKPKIILEFEKENSFTLLIFNEIKEGKLSNKELMDKHKISIEKLAGAIYRLKKKGYEIHNENGRYILDENGQI